MTNEEANLAEAVDATEAAFSRMIENGLRDEPVAAAFMAKAISTLAQLHGAEAMSRRLFLMSMQLSNSIRPGPGDLH